MKPSGALLLDVLRTPAKLSGLSPAQWDALLPLARNARLAARVRWLAEHHRVLERLDSRARRQLDNAWLEALEQDRLLRWEILRVHRALHDLDCPVLLLKGAAYLLADLPPAPGRFSSDVDFLVPRQHLDMVEQTLQKHGWQSVELDDYDQRYYRQWMHELPPMHHRDRNTTIDIHHTLTPLCGRLHPDPRKLFNHARPINGLRFGVPAPTDLVLHSALHLFGEGEFGSALRDLVDIDALLRHFGAEENFWPQLRRRSEELGLGRPLFYALYFSRKLLHTPMPEPIMGHRPGALVLALMDRLVTRAAVPEPPDDTAILTSLSELLLLIRGHWLRMPPLMLARHLTHKTLVRLLPPRDKQDVARQERPEHKET